MSNNIESAYDSLKGHQHQGIWLEVSEVLLQAPLVFVRLAGDKAPHEPDWWCVKDTSDADKKAEDKATKAAAAKQVADRRAATTQQKEGADKLKKEADELREKANKTAADLATRLFDAIEKKRLVLAKLSHANGNYLYCSEIRIQSGETNTR